MGYEMDEKGKPAKCLPRRGARAGLYYYQGLLHAEKGSNLRPSVLETAALPTELSAQKPRYLGSGENLIYMTALWKGYLRSICFKSKLKGY